MVEETGGDREEKGGLNGFRWFFQFFLVAQEHWNGKGGRRKEPALSTEVRLWLVKLEFFVDGRRREGNSSRLVAFAR